MITDKQYTPNSRPRGRLKQIGSNTPYASSSRPLLSKLESYDNMSMYEPVIKQAISIISGTIIGSLGDISHPDPDIQKYIEYSLSRMSDFYNVDYRLALKKIISCTIRSGFNVTECLYELHNGQIYINDFVNYHPSTIIIRTNKQGRLTEGEPSLESPVYNSGIYQHNTYNIYQQANETLLPMWKICYIANQGEVDNVYGTSLLEPCFRWHVLKEAFVDMKTETLDRYGNPLTAIIIPQMSSGISEVDSYTGEERRLSSQEYLQRQLENTDPSSSSYLFLPFVDNNMKPDAKVLTTANNLGDVFLKAIKFCEQQMAKSLLIPYGFIEEDTNTNSNISERQIELFNRTISTLYKQFVFPFISQTIHRAIKYNFNRESANVPPLMPLKNITRPEERVALMQTIRGLTETGYLNPTNDKDWDWVRETVDSIPRVQSKEDVEFVKQLLVYPRQPTEPLNNKSSKTKTTKGTTTPRRDRSTEGAVKGTASPGRPTGVSDKVSKPDR